MTKRRLIGRATIAIAGAFVAVGICETFVRAFDGYELFSPRLVRRHADAPAPLTTATDGGKLLAPNAAYEYVRQLPHHPTVDLDWFRLDPLPLPELPVDPELRARYLRHAGHEVASVYEWNLAYVRDAVCSGADVDDAVFHHLEDIYVYGTPDDEPRPSYRFLPATHYPSGLHTNAFGWRGRDVDAVKPSGRIRLAFVGASTTVAPHADPFSYPEYVGRWLEEWARAYHPGVTIDVINAGREGIDSSSIAAIIEQELLPMTPDLVVYYEGANQFWPSNFVVNDLPFRLLRTMRPQQWLETHSAIAVRAAHLVRSMRQDGAEPIKPPLWVRWPSDLDETEPALDDDRLPVQLPAILGDLDRARRALDERDVTLVLSSFVWIVEDGLQLDPDGDHFIDAHLNDYYWPFSYAHMRRYADFQNLVFRKYAAAHSLPFVDLAAVYPRDPRLFVDAIHMTPAGVKLHGWLVLQQLVPILEAGIANGRWPAEPEMDGAPPHPPPAERRLIRVEDIRAACGPQQ